jgi:GTPase KRas
MSEQNCCYNIVVVGDVNVGKSVLTIQLVQNVFLDEYDPTITDRYRKQVCIDSEICLLDILDTGQEGYACRSPSDMDLRYADGFLVVYSITSKPSFDSTDELRDRLLLIKDQDHVPMVLCGNKCDLEMERKVTSEDGWEKAQKWSCPFFHTSAKERVNVEESFFELVREIRYSHHLNHLKKRKKGEKEEPRVSSQMSRNVKRAKT